MRLINIISIGIAFILMQCAEPNKTSSSNGQKPGLKDYYREHFKMGVAVYPKALDGSQAHLIRTHFESMTPENVMKIGPIHPAPGVYNWDPADKIVAFARENNLALRGHALCWHNQTPEWFFKTEGDSLLKDTLLNRLQDHITTVVSRYKDDIYAWDVVNEAISDKKDQFYRDSEFFKVCGEDFITKAFEYARAADPDVQLFYNDYEVINPVKRQKIYDMIKSMKEAGVPIDGIGIQGHWSVFEPSEQQLRETISAFTDLGLKIQITELDVSVYKKEHSRRDKLPDETDEFTPELQQLQADQYEMIFNVLRENSEHISSVTFWNISDRYSWLDNFPVAGRKDYPLLFDQNLQPKESYHRITSFSK